MTPEAVATRVLASADAEPSMRAITTILDAGRAVDDLRRDVTAEDIAASLIGIFTVAPRLRRGALASRLLDLLMDGLRPPVRR